LKRTFRSEKKGIVTEQRTLSGAAIGTAAGGVVGTIAGNTGIGLAAGAAAGAAGTGSRYLFSSRYAF